MNISKSVSLVYEDLSKIVNEIVYKQFRSQHPDEDSDIELQQLYSIINLKNPEKRTTMQLQHLFNFYKR